MSDSRSVRARPEPARPAGAAATEDAPPDEGARLLARHLDGDARAFEALVRRYKGSIYGYFRRSGVREATADELFQEVFLRVHANGHRYAAVRPFRVWLFTIAHNLLRSHFRKQKVRRIMVGWWTGDGHRDARPLDPPDRANPAPDEHAAARESLRWLEDALAALPDNPRRALILTKIEGMRLSDAADVLQVPVPTVKTWVRRGRLALVEARARAEQTAPTSGGAS